ncbi:hypothetical protein ACTA71_007846 [Dictyostelium dimigraforme]
MKKPNLINKLKKKKKRKGSQKNEVSFVLFGIENLIETFSIFGTKTDGDAPLLFKLEHILLTNHLSILSTLNFLSSFNIELVTRKEESIKSNIITILGIQQFNELIEKSKTATATTKIITYNSTIYFTKAANQLMVDDFKLITLEYIEINKLLLSNNLKCKHVLVTLNSDNINYLSAYVMGTYRYLNDKQKFYSPSSSQAENIKRSIQRIS